MSQTSAHCWRCAWACHRRSRQVATFQVVLFSTSLPNIQCIIVVGCTKRLAVVVGEEIPKKSIRRSEPFRIIAVASTCCPDDAFLLHLPWTRIPAGRLYLVLPCTQSHGPVVSPRSAGVAKLFRKQPYE